MLCLWNGTEGPKRQISCEKLFTHFGLDLAPFTSRVSLMFSLFPGVIWKRKWDNAQSVLVTVLQPFEQHSAVTLTNTIGSCFPPTLAGRGPGISPPRRAATNPGPAGGCGHPASLLSHLPSATHCSTHQESGIHMTPFHLSSQWYQVTCAWHCLTRSLQGLAPLPRLHKMQAVAWLVKEALHPQHWQTLTLSSNLRANSGFFGWRISQGDVCLDLPTWPGLDHRAEERVGA